MRKQHPAVLVLALTAAPLVLALASRAAALDTVATANKAKLSGKVQQISTTEVTILRTGKDEAETVPVNEILSVRFEGEPAQLNAVRTALEGGKYVVAQKNLEKLDADKVERPEIKVEIIYYRALTVARLALAGQGTIAEAGKAMNAFIKDNPTSFHFLEANEVVGDLLVANAAYENAEKFYKLVEEQAPWQDYKMRAAAARGRAQLKQGKTQEALAVFDSVISMAAGLEGPLVARQKMLATVGKGQCLGQTGQVEEGAKLLEALIAEADPEEAELHALAYTALGNCYRKADKKKEARMAFLHVHILYPGFPDAHAEALANLADLWKELGDAGRAAEAQETLLAKYPNSPWSKR